MAKRVQDFIPLEEIRDGVVIMKDHSLRAVLLATSINFDLKSGDEQIAILNQYQNFLNSLDFSIQILVQSRNIDIKPYLTILDERIKEQVNDLLKIQTREYAEFIRNVTEQTNVMSKSFYIVIPYTPKTFTAKKGTFLSSLFGGKKSSNEQAKQILEKFEENRSQLEQRKTVIASGLASIGIRTASLGTEELVELFYTILNPGEHGAPAGILGGEQ